LTWDVVYSTLYTLTWDTSHTSAGRDPFESYIDADVCVHSPGSINRYKCETEEAYWCVV